MTRQVLQTGVERGVATIWLNRPEVRNALDARLATELAQALRQLAADPEVRLLVLGGQGPMFCAGADLAWMARMARAGEEENRNDARLLQELFATLYLCPKPVVARIHGGAIGGALGLVAAADIAIASSDAVFAASEVRLGLIPAVISPYVVNAIGLRAAGRYFLSGERFDAATAHALGLVHEVCGRAGLDAEIARITAALLQGGPGAQGEIKSLLRERAKLSTAGLAERLATVRQGNEARAGLQAFLDRQSAPWST